MLGCAVGGGAPSVSGHPRTTPGPQATRCDVTTIQGRDTRAWRLQQAHVDGFVSRPIPVHGGVMSRLPSPFIIWDLDTSPCWPPGEFPLLTTPITPPPPPYRITVEHWYISMVTYIKSTHGSVPFKHNVGGQNKV